MKKQVLPTIVQQYLNTIGFDYEDIVEFYFILYENSVTATFYYNKVVYMGIRHLKNSIFEPDYKTLKAGERKH